jgi:hypothetical protein
MMPGHLASVVLIKGKIEMCHMEQVFMIGNTVVPVARYPCRSRTTDKEQGNCRPIDQWSKNSSSLKKGKIERLFFRTGIHTLQAGVAFIRQHAGDVVNLNINRTSSRALFAFGACLFIPMDFKDTEQTEGAKECSIRTEIATPEIAY